MLELKSTRSKQKSKCKTLISHNDLLRQELVFEKFGYAIKIMISVTKRKMNNFCKKLYDLIFENPCIQLSNLSVIKCTHKQIKNTLTELLISQNYG